MKTEKTRYVVQYKSVYEAVGIDWKDMDEYISIEDAKRAAAALRAVNPQVRILSRQITETLVP